MKIYIVHQPGIQEPGYYTTLRAAYLDNAEDGGPHENTLYAHNFSEGPYTNRAGWKVERVRAWTTKDVREWLEEVGEAGPDDFE